MYDHMSHVVGPYHNAPHSELILKFLAPDLGSFLQPLSLLDILTDALAKGKGARRSTHDMKSMNVISGLRLR
jgi:hypothetical protein